MVTTGRYLLLLLCFATGALVTRAATDVRFSATLAPDLRERAGLSQLNSDNIAVIDGLVRQDEAASKFKDNDVDHTRFSERHTPRERELAGLNRLNGSQRSLLDDLVYQRINGTLPATSVAAIVSGSATGTAVKPNLPTQKLDIHGEIGFTYGWGKGGSFSGGDIVLTYDDPEGRYSVLAAYSEYRGKGLSPCLFPGYGPYRAYPGAMPFSR